MASETFCTLKPAPGATHNPDTVGGPWTYPFGGQEENSIFETREKQPARFEFSKPPPSRGMPRAEAEHALAYFTPPGGDADPLVEIEYHQGERRTTFAPITPPAFTDPATGIVYDSVEELAAAMQARIESASGPKPEGDPRTPGNPSARQEANATAATGTTERPRDTSGTGRKAGQRSADEE